MMRVCQPELLDHLPVHDLAAVKSRRDLRRVNAWMGNARFMAQALKASLAGLACQRILEVGAGDGTFLLKVVRRLGAGDPGRTALLLDRQDIVQDETRAAFHDAGWNVETVVADIFDYLKDRRATEPVQRPLLCDGIVANLFLHHFSNEELVKLFEGAQKRTSLFIAVEPRRSWVSVLGGKALWAIGCNQVTRHDARISIKAGFTGRELSALWPPTPGWHCEERRVGFSSHLFIAKRAEESIR